MILKLPNEERSVEKLLSPDMLAGLSLWSALVRNFGGPGGAFVEEFRRAQHAFVVSKIPKDSKVSRANKLLGNPTKKRRIGSSNSVLTIAHTSAELELGHDESLDMVPQQQRDISASLADHAKESGSGSCSEKLIVGKDMALALSLCCESVELSLLKDGVQQAKNDRNAPWMMCSLVTSMILYMSND